MNDSQICEIHIEKSALARKLESDLSIDWEFEVYNHLEPFYHLRACIEEDLIIEPGEIIPIPTGIYAQLLNPNFVIEVCSLSGLIYHHKVVMPEGVTYFPYTFRDEIWIFLENKNTEAMTIQPAQKIAQFTVKQPPRMVIKYVDQIEEIDSKIQTGKSYIQKIKNKIRGISKKERESIGYSRSDIEDYINGS